MKRNTSEANCPIRKARNAARRCKNRTLKSGGSILNTSICAEATAALMWIAEQRYGSKRGSKRRAIEWALLTALFTFIERDSQ